MTPIEHFLTDIMQILFADWIEDSVAGIGREIAPTDIFQPTLSNFFKKLSLADNVFLTAEEVFLFWCCINKFTMYVR